MIVARRPFSRLDRTAAVILGLTCLAAGVATVVVGLARGRLLLSALGTPVIALGLAYAIAAWRGRPLGPR